MRLTLNAHPDFASVGVSAIQAEIERDGPSLTLRYRLTGDISALAVSASAPQARTDELWRHTCFEAFLRPPGAGYVELNFAPSSLWAAYRFSGYRDGMAPAEVTAPRIETTAGDRSLNLAVSLDLASLRLPPGPCRLALSAVIEARSGAKSYWALAHPPGRPDFHHDAGFASALPT